MANDQYPVTVPAGLSNVVAIAEGEDFCLAITTNRAVAEKFQKRALNMQTPLFEFNLESRRASMWKVTSETCRASPAITPRCIRCCRPAPGTLIIGRIRQPPPVPINTGTTAGTRADQVPTGCCSCKAAVPAPLMPARTRKAGRTTCGRGCRTGRGR